MALYVRDLSLIDLSNLDLVLPLSVPFPPPTRIIIITALLPCADPPPANQPTTPLVLLSLSLSTARNLRGLIDRWDVPCDLRPSVNFVIDTTAYSLFGAWTGDATTVASN